MDTAGEKIPRTVALCYVRQSMSRPGQPQRSPEQQRANIEAVCAQHGWQPLWFVEAAGHRSGFGEAQRPAWRRLKEWLHLPGVAALVANEPSRVYRHLYRMLQLVELLDGHEIRCLFASPHSLVKDLADPHDRMVLQVVGTHDEHVVHLLSEQQRELLAGRRAKGQTCGMPPFSTVRDGDGYLMRSQEGIFARKEAWAARNRQLCARYTQGEMLSALAREFHLSPQRVYQIVHEERWWEGRAERDVLKVA